MSADKYGVSVQKVAAQGKPFWEAVNVEHVPAGMNHGNHHVYVDVYGDNGASYRWSPTVQIKWGWEGQKDAERADLKSLEKPINEHMTNVPMDAGQKIWVEVTSPDNYPSDRVVGLHTNHPDEGADVRTGHHSFNVEFRLNPGSRFEEKTEENNIKRRLQALAAELDDILRTLP